MYILFDTSPNRRVLAGGSSTLLSRTEESIFFESSLEAAAPTSIWVFSRPVWGGGWVGGANSSTATVHLFLNKQRQVLVQATVETVSPRVSM